MQFATVITLLALLPTIAILLYSSYALAPNTAPSAATNGNHPTTSSKDRKTPLRSPTPPTIRLLLVALFTSSLSFFLFSFQVHEKSILLPLMPLTLLMISRGSSKDGRDGGDELWEMGVLINNVAVFRCVSPRLSVPGRVTDNQHVAATRARRSSIAICRSNFALELHRRLLASSGHERTFAVLWLCASICLNNPDVVKLIDAACLLRHSNLASVGSVTQPACQVPRPLPRAKRVDFVWDIWYSVVMGHSQARRGGLGDWRNRREFWRGETQDWRRGQAGRVDGVSTVIVPLRDCWSSITYHRHALGVPEK